MIHRELPGDTIDAKIDRSSLGDREAKTVRARTPSALATRIVEMSTEGRKPAPRTSPRGSCPPDP